jgi:hypothetical protein
MAFATSRPPKDSHVRQGRPQSVPKDSPPSPEDLQDSPGSAGYPRRFRVPYKAPKVPRVTATNSRVNWGASGGDRGGGPGVSWGSPEPTRLARIGPDWIGLGRIGPDGASSNVILMHRCERFFTFYTGRSRVARKNACKTYL